MLDTPKIKARLREEAGLRGYHLVGEDRIHKVAERAIPKRFNEAAA